MLRKFHFLFSCGQTWSIFCYDQQAIDYVAKSGYATCRALWIDLSLHKCTCLSFFFARLSVCRARCVQTPALLALTTSTAGFHLSVLFLSTIIFDAKSAAVHWLACTLFVCLEALFELHSGNGAIVTTGHIATMSTDSVTVSLAIKGRRWSKK